jgi:acyl carrier protein
MIEEIKDIVAAVFEIDKSKIDDNIKKFDYEKWDSLGHINLIAALEEHFDIMLEPEEMASIETIDDIEKLILKYKQS